MRKTLALLAMTSLAAACGGDTLDVGGGSKDGSTGDPSVDSGIPGGPPNSTVIVSEQRAIPKLALHGSHLYWIELGNGDSSLERCVTSDCKDTSEVLGRRVSDFGFFGNDLYMTARDAGAEHASLLSCPLDDCTSPKKMAAITAAPGAIIVDESGIYWSNALDSAIYTCPLAGCDMPERTVASGFFTYGPLVTDEKRLFYFVQTATRGVYDLASALKDGTAPPLVIASGQKNPTPPRILDGFVYWASVLPQGYVARCPVTGCTNGQPEILAKNQRYPLSVEPEGNSLFWINENAGTTAGSTTPATIASCPIASCANAATLIDHAEGPASFLNLGTTPMSQILVADTDAIYYVGDQRGRDVDGGVPGFLDFAIRRLPRNR